MAKTRSTKRALLMSALALLLCVSMLVGSTFAWFTDEVTSAGNIIKSGTLDVEMYWAKGTEAPDSANWQDASTGAIFNYDLWEPGYTEVRHIKIANEGTLALKYQLNILANGEVSALADVIDVYFIDPAEQIADRTDLDEADKVGTLAEILAGMPANTSGTLTAETEAVVTIALKMQETAGNEYQNLSIGTDFTVQLLATQVAYEKDSFDELYDDDSAFGNYVELEEGGDLLAVLASAEANKPITIKLLGDVELPTGSSLGVADITPASKVVINGNGNTITVTGNGITSIGDKEATITIKNADIIDNSKTYNESAWEISYCDFGGAMIFEKVNFADAVMANGPSATFVECSFVGHPDKNSGTTQYAVWVYGGDATFTNCTVTGTRGIKICDDYSAEVGTVVIDGCTFTGLSEKPGVAIDDKDTQDMNIIIKNSTFINCKAGDQGLYIYETDNTLPTLENNTVLNNAEFASTKAELLAYSGKTLTSNNGKAEEAVIILSEDIDLQGEEFSSIVAQRGDKLTIVGNGHKISNAKIVSGANDNTTGQAGMFYAYPGSTLIISNLTLENITVTADADATGYAAVVAGYCEGTAILNNVDVVNATVIGVKSSGALIGHLAAGAAVEAKNCELSGTVTLATYSGEPEGHYAGKFFGTIGGAVTLENCTADVTVSGSLKAANVGDVYGRIVSGGSLN